MSGKDQLGNTVAIQSADAKVISLVPSITETLLHLDVNVVGRTKFCIHPMDIVSDIAKIGGTKNPSIQAIRAMQPDIVIANKEENNESDIKEISKFVDVYISNIIDHDTSMSFIHDMGDLLHRRPQASKLITEIEYVKTQIPINQNRPNVLYAIWYDPLMVAGHDTYINAMLSIAGLNNLCLGLRYPEIDIKKFVNDVDVLLLSSEPYPFKESHVKEFQNLGFKKVILVDGEMFSWYGVRQKEAYRYFRDILSLT